VGAPGAFHGFGGDMLQSSFVENKQQRLQTRFRAHHTRPHEHCPPDWIVVKSHTLKTCKYAQARFNLERKSWAERVERIEKIAADAKQDAKNAGDEVTRLQVCSLPHG
jgi:hypothetical protein